MGCFSSKYSDSSNDAQTSGRKVKWTVGKPWTADTPMDRARLQRMRDEFWDTQPAYGGDRVIWDALKAACETDLATARIIVDSAGIIVAAPDMSVCYDERGAKYDLPSYVLCEPSNLQP